MENSFESKKAVISLSGGLDSTCLLLKLLADGYDVRAYSFDYGQKHEVELKKVKKNIKFLKSKGLPLTHQIINLRDVFSDSASSLHKGGDDIPHGMYDQDNMKSTVVENRNIIFSAIIYGKALAWANQTSSNVVITQGLHAGDHSIYPDCRPESQEMARELYKISNWGSERVDFIAPFINIHKGAVLREGLDAMKKLEFTWAEINKVLRNTHTCYDPNDKGESCGLCGSCTERIEAFAFNLMEDPAKYSLTKDELNEKYAEAYARLKPQN